MAKNRDNKRDATGRVFKEGDRVRLIKPFRCSGDGAEEDEDYDRGIRERQPGIPEPEGNVDELGSEWILIQFDNYKQALFTDGDRIEIVVEPTPEEIQAAIQSIIGSNC